LYSYHCPQFYPSNKKAVKSTGKLCQLFTRGLLIIFHKHRNNCMVFWSVFVGLTEVWWFMHF
jgi:hypothetical protein